MDKKIGLLVPKSVIYPSMGFDIIGGLRKGLTDMGIEGADIKVENIGIGADDKMIYGACEKLLFDGYNIVTGYVNPLTAEKLEPLFESAGAVFFALDAGYHYPSSSKKKTHVFTISLQGTLCSRILSTIAVNEGRKNFAFLGSFYDSGYRSIHAYFRGLEEAGGTITFNHVTKLKRSDFTLEPLLEHLGSGNTDSILTSFCGDMMQDFFAHAANNPVFATCAIYGSAFMGDEQWLSQSPYPGTDIKTCITWASVLDNKANNHFKAVMTGAKQRTSIFSVLGWEAAQLAAPAITATEVNDVISALEHFQYDSPRGTITINEHTHQALAPVYEAWIKKDESNGNCRLELIRTSPYAEQQRIQLEQDIDNFSGVTSSWQNAYACLDS